MRTLARFPTFPVTALLAPPYAGHFFARLPSTKKSLTSKTRIGLWSVAHRGASANSYPAGAFKVGMKGVFP